MARPREFDIDEALDQAIEAFWKRGYEATSMADLMEAMGLQKGSIYKAFHDKHSLFLAALDRYMNHVYEGARQILSQAPSPREGIQAWLIASRNFGRDENMRKGCMGINSMAELGPHDQEVQDLMKKHFQRMESLLSGVIIEGQTQGQFRQDLNAGRLANFLAVFAAGTMVTSKASFSSLDDEELIEVALSAVTGL